MTPFVPKQHYYLRIADEEDMNEDVEIGFHVSMFTL